MGSYPFEREQRFLRFLLRVYQLDCAQSLAGGFVASDLQDLDLPEALVDVLQQVGRRGLVVLVTAVGGEHERVEQRLGGQEFLVEQGPAFDGFLLIIQADAGDDFGGMTDEMGEVVVLKDDEVVLESVLGERFVERPLGMRVQVVADQPDSRRLPDCPRSSRSFRRPRVPRP